jgi:hypothetical protein
LVQEVDIVTRDGDNRSMIQRAIESKSDIQMDLALHEAGLAGFTHDDVPVLIAALREPWHYSHEAIVTQLQWLKDPMAVDVLFETAHRDYDYRDYDEVAGLARRCTWALADIGTPAAFVKLQELVREEIDMVSGYAQKRLDNWEKEKPRKGYA